MKFIRGPLLISIVIVVGLYGQAMGCIVSATVVNTEIQLKHMTTSVSLVVVATIKSIEYEKNGLRGRFNANVVVAVDEVWKGSCGASIVLQIVEVNGPELTNRSCFDKTRPDKLSIGEQYVFICRTRFDYQNKTYEDGYMVPMGGLLGYNRDAGELFYYGSLDKMDIPNSAKVFQSVLSKGKPDNLADRADLVVVVEGFSIQGQAEPFHCEPARAVTSARVVKVLKGEFSANEIQFDPVLATNNRRAPRITSNDRAILYLMAIDGKFGLLEGPDGYKVLVDKELLHHSRMPLGWYLNENWELKEGVKP